MQTQQYWLSLAADYELAAPRGVFHYPSRLSLLLAMSVAEHETENGRAWPGEWNFGAVQLRGLTQDELQAFQAGTLVAGARTTVTNRSDVPEGALHVDTHPPGIPYPVWFCAFPTRPDGIVFFLHVLWRLSLVKIAPIDGPQPHEVGLLASMFGSSPAAKARATGADKLGGGVSAAELPAASPETLAEAMYRHGYFEGSTPGARPVAQRIGDLTAPEVKNVAAYASGIARCLAEIQPALELWSPAWEGAMTSDEQRALIVAQQDMLAQSIADERSQDQVAQTQGD